jgi:hypothetical protein
MKRDELPIFTATSAIPFAAHLQENTTPGKREQLVPKAEPGVDESVWEVPETPGK